MMPIKAVMLGIGPVLLLMLPSVVLADSHGSLTGCTKTETGKLVRYKLTPGKTLPNAIGRPLTGRRGDPNKGLKVMVSPSQGNCIACHAVSKIKEKAKSKSSEILETYSYHGKIGPSLDGVAARYSSAELRLIVVDAKMAFPTQNTIMPAYYRVDGLKRVQRGCEGLTILSAIEVEDVVAFLEKLNTPPLPTSKAKPDSAQSKGEPKE